MIWVFDKFSDVRQQKLIEHHRAMETRKNLGVDPIPN